MSGGRLDFYYDIVCPYAYLASTQVEAVAARAGARVVWRPVLLGGVLRAVGGPEQPAEAMSAPRARLNLLDMHRWAEHWGVPLSMPAGHPRRTVEVMRLLLAVDEAVRPALSRAFFEAYWVKGDDVSDPAVRTRVATALGVDAALAERPEAREGLFAATAEAVERGAFGVPTFGVGARIFWGQDRLSLVEAALRAGGVAPTLRFFHDFSSPFSYLASTQVERVAARRGATLVMAPILLGALFRDIGTPNVPLFAMSAARRRYQALDMEDWARLWGVPLRFPSHFPIRSVLPLRVSLVEPATVPFIYRAAWVEDRRIDTPEALRPVLDDAGFDGAALIAAADGEAPRSALRAHTAQAEALGACGVPTFSVEWPGAAPMVYWGQDRIERVSDALVRPPKPERGGA